MLEVCGICGSLYEVVDEDDTCPECEERRERAEARSRRAKESKRIEQLAFDRIEKVKALDDPIQLSDTIFTVLSGSDKKKSYTVVRVEGDKFTCDCPDYRYRKHGTLDCKHIIKVREYLQRQATEHKAEARTKIEANHKGVYVEAGFYD